MKYLLYSICCSLIMSCQQSKTAPLAAEKKEVVKERYAVGNKMITDEISGSAYRKRATTYFMIKEKDTSTFRPIFVAFKDKGKIGLDLRYSYGDTISIRYTDRIQELKEILPIAATTYNLDSLQHISIGRLIYTGDLAIDVTNEYLQKFETSTGIDTKEYSRIAAFLKESQLGKDFNALLKPYGLAIERISIEKAFFTTNDVLADYSILDTETSRIPNKILDCSIWVYLKKEPQGL